MTRHAPHPLVTLLATLLALAPAAIARAQEGPVLPGAGADGPAMPLKFVVTYDASVTDSYTGPVYVLLHAASSPKTGPIWWRNEVTIRVDAEDWKPGEPLVIAAGNAMCYPMDFDEIPARNYVTMAAMRTNRNVSRPGGVDNHSNAITRMPLDPASSGLVPLEIDEALTPQRNISDVSRVTVAKRRSSILSDALGYDVDLEAVLLLPPGYELEPDRRYPVRYVIGPHGEDETTNAIAWRRYDTAMGANDIITIYLDTDTYGGHHRFVDSEANGPRMQSLFQEVIPWLENAYRVDSDCRVLIGLNDGGWSALWLAMQRPEAFQKVYAIAPSFVDLRNWFLLDLYAPDANMLYAADGSPRTIIERGGEPFADAVRFNDLERIWGPGAWLTSHEWSWSPIGEDGLPRPLYDRETGAVDPVTVQAWSRYDLVRQFAARGAALRDGLTGKLTIVVGDEDNYRNDESVRALEAVLATQGIDARVEYVPGGDYKSLIDTPRQKSMMLEIVELYGRIVAAREAAAAGSADADRD